MSQPPDMRSAVRWVRNGGTMRERLNELHDEEEMSWREIAEMPEFKERDIPIPAGSLCSYAGGWEPKTERSRRMFGLPVTVLIPQVRGKDGRFLKRTG